MPKILIISTGGTFNKIYQPLDGSLPIDKNSQAIDDIASHWRCKLEKINIIGKDSLDMTMQDRALLTKLIKTSKEEKILIIHGTDTMDITAKYLEEAKVNKYIILTGAMIPYAINPIEATANLASAYAYLLALEKKGVYIAMNARIDLAKNIQKNRQKGFFEICS